MKRIIGDHMRSRITQTATPITVDLSYFIACTFSTLLLMRSFRRHRVIQGAIAEWVAPQYTSYSKPASIEKAVHTNSFFRVC